MDVYLICYNAGKKDSHRMLRLKGALSPAPSELTPTHVQFPPPERPTDCSTRLWLLTINPRPAPGPIILPCKQINMLFPSVEIRIIMNCILQLNKYFFLNISLISENITLYSSYNVNNVVQYYIQKMHPFLVRTFSYYFMFNYTYVMTPFDFVNWWHCIDYAIEIYISSFSNIVWIKRCSKL